MKTCRSCEHSEDSMQGLFCKEKVELAPMVEAKFCAWFVYEPGTDEQTYEEERE